MSILKDRWNRLPSRWRLRLMAAAVLALAAWSTVWLMFRGMPEVLYKGF